ncbi:MAG: YlbF family regulator [Gemmatimonadota bacterium]
MMTEGMTEKARDLGRLIGQADEYKALERARERFSSDREAVERVNQLAQLETEIAQALQRNEEPTEQARELYERTFSELQAIPSYQAVVAAQSNFDRILAKVNEEISKGVETGATSRIILPS